MKTTNRPLTTILATMLFLTLLAGTGLAHGGTAKAGALRASTQQYVNVYGSYRLLYPGAWSGYREHQSTDVFLVAPDRHAGVRMLVVPETVAPSADLLLAFLHELVQPIGALVGQPLVRSVNLQDGVGQEVDSYFRLNNGTTGVVLAEVTAYQGYLYGMIGVVVGAQARYTRYDARQVEGVLHSLTFGSFDQAPGDNGNLAGPGASSDWTYVGLGGDAGGNGQCFYYDDPDTGSSVMTGNC